MKLTFKRFRHQNSDDVWEDIPEKRSLAHTILDLLFFVQFPDVRQMLVAENGQSVFRQLHVLQADGFEHKINVFHPKIPVIQLDDAANR